MTPRPAQPKPAIVSVSPSAELPTVTLALTSLRFAPTISIVRTAGPAVSDSPASVSVLPATFVIVQIPTRSEIVIDWPTRLSVSSTRPKKSELPPTMSSWPRPPKTMSSPPPPST